MNLTRTYVVTLCAECGAQLLPGHAASGDDPCGCFGAHFPRVERVVTLDALLSDEAVEAALRAVYNDQPQLHHDFTPKTYEECYGHAPLDRADDVEETRILLRAAVDAAAGRSGKSLPEPEHFNPNDGWDQTKTSVDETTGKGEPS